MAHSASHTPQEGFTLVELLISILLTSIIMGAIYSVYRVQTHSAKVQEMRQEAQEYARSVMDIMVREIRNAGYNPASASSTTCTGTIVPGAPGVITATATSFRFTYDFQDPGGGAPNSLCNDTNEDITYDFATTGCPSGFGNVTRQDGGNPAQALTDCNIPDVTGQRLDLRYFTQAGAELSRPVTGADLATIQRVLITLTVQSKKPDAQFGGQLNAQMSSNADLRNRGLPQ